jgi:hypothetical protein
MGNRISHLGILTLLSLAATGSGPSAALAQRGHSQQAVSAVRAENPGASVGVTWTLRDREIFACESATYDLRALLRSYGGRVDVRVIAVDADPALIASFLRRERLDLRVSHVSTADYRRAFHSEPVPGVAVTQRGRLVENLNAGQMQVRERRDTSSLLEIVGRLLSPGARYSLGQR